MIDVKEVNFDEPIPEDCPEHLEPAFVEFAVYTTCVPR